MHNPGNGPWPGYGYPQHAQAQAYGHPQQPPMQHQAMPMQQAMPVQQQQPQSQGLSMGLGGFGVGIPGIGGLGAVDTAGLNKRANSMSPALVPLFFLVAIVVGFAFDVVFTFVHVPFGRYIWYAATILPFALAGILGALWTRSGKPGVLAAAIVASLVYGACDIGLGVALGATEGGISLAYILNLAAFSVGISLAGGIGGTIRGAMQKASVAS